MDDVVFEDDNSARKYIFDQLAPHVPHWLTADLAEQLAVRCQCPGPLDDWPEVAPATGPLEIGEPFFGPWTVREEELCDIKELAFGVVAAVASPSTYALSLLMSAACMIWRLRRRGVSINPLQRDVLIALRASPGLALEQLARKARTLGNDWCQADVEGALEELASIRLKDGSVVSLVHCDSGKFWSTNARGLWEVPFGSVG